MAEPPVHPGAGAGAGAVRVVRRVRNPIAEPPIQGGDSELTALLQQEDWNSDEAHQALERFKAWATSLPSDAGALLQTLFLAIEKRKNPIVGALIDVKGPQILLETRGGDELESAFGKITSDSGAFTVLQYIINKHPDGIDLNAAFRLATRQQDEDCVELLVSKGTDLQLVTNALEIKKALQQRHDKMRNILDFHQFKTEFPTTKLFYLRFGSKAVEVTIGDFQTRSFKSLNREVGVMAGLAGSATWVHIPSTNGVVALAVIRAFQREIMQRTGTFLSTDIPLREFLPPPIPPSDPWLRYREPSFKFLSASKDPFIAPAAEKYFSIVFPFLALETLKTHDDKRNIYNSLLKKVPGSGSKIHFERTLHEAYYPSLNTKILNIQNEAQSVTRETGMVLLLPQLWLWSLDEYVVSACSFPGDTTLYERIHDTEWKDDERRKIFGHAFLNPISPIILMGVILAEKVLTFANPSDSNLPSVLDIFQQGIFTILSDVTVYTEQPVDTVPNILRERDFLKRTAQLRGELAIIIEILGRQGKIMDDQLLQSNAYEADKMSFIDDGARSLHKNYDHIQVNHWEIIIRARRELQKCRERVDNMDRDAMRIEASIKDQLDLKRTHASMSDARFSLVLGVAVAGFTIVTVIFTPLSFVSSLFALSVDQFATQQYDFAPNKTNPGVTVRAYYSSYFGKWFTVAEVASLAVTAIVVMLSMWLGGAFTIKGLWEWLKNLPRKNSSGTAKGVSDPSVSRVPTFQRVPIALVGNAKPGATPAQSIDEKKDDGDGGNQCDVTLLGRLTDWEQPDESPRL